MEHVSDGQYLRSVRLNDRSGWVAIGFTPGDSVLQVRASESLAPVQSELRLRLERLFDVQADTVEIEKTLGPLGEQFPGLRVPGSFEAFEMTVRAILGQQISVQAARTLAGRLALHFGDAVQSPYPELTRTFPTAQLVSRLTIDEIASKGIVAARTRAIRSLAKAIESGELRLEPGVDHHETRQQLLDLPGIGPWTASYLAMRTLQDRDAFPASDLGIMKALDTRSPKVAESLAEKWRPYRAYAALRLWRGATVAPVL